VQSIGVSVEPVHNVGLSMMLLLKEIEREMGHVRLEMQALNTQLHRPGWFTRIMFGFANWMIVTGKQLRRRYEVPVAGCQPVSTKSFAR